MNYIDTAPIPDNVLTITNLLSHTINTKYTTELKLVGKRRFNVVTVASRVSLFWINSCSQSSLAVMLIHWKDYGELEGKQSSALVSLYSYPYFPCEFELSLKV